MKSEMCLARQPAGPPAGRRHAAAACTGTGTVLQRGKVGLVAWAFEMVQVVGRECVATRRYAAAAFTGVLKRVELDWVHRRLQWCKLEKKRVLLMATRVAHL